jgi:hypothetical protein
MPVLDDVLVDDVLVGPKAPEPPPSPVVDVAVLLDWQPHATRAAVSAPVVKKSRKG